MSLLVLAERLDSDAPQQVYGQRIGATFSSVMIAAQAGADWAWTRLYRSLARPLLGYLRGQGAEDPEALLGDVFLQIARNIVTFEGDEDDFRSWAFLVAHHRILDDRRRRRRRPVTPVPLVPDHIGGSTEDDALAGLLDDEVLGALRSLTPEQRDVVLLRVFADLPIDEVSVVVNRPVSAVKALQRRAYARLRQQISASQYPDDDLRR